MGKKIIYDLPPGLALKKRYRGKDYVLVVKESEGKTKFEVNDKTFDSLTAAAQFVVKSNRPISGPFFWKAPQKETR